MTKSIRPRLVDILQSIDVVETAIVGKDYETFNSDVVLRFAVERAIEIISEAVRHIPDHDRSLQTEIPWRNISAIGNRLRHEYQRVDPDIIWEIATVYLPQLRPAIESILARYD